MRVLLRSVLEALAETLTLRCSPTPDTVWCHVFGGPLAARPGWWGPFVFRSLFFAECRLFSCLQQHVARREKVNSTFFFLRCQTSRPSATVCDRATHGGSHSSYTTGPHAEHFALAQVEPSPPLPTPLLLKCFGVFFNDAVSDDSSTSASPQPHPSPCLALPPSHCLCLGRLQLWSIRDLSPLLHIDVKVHDLGFPLIKKSMRLSIKGWLFVLCQSPLVLRQPSSCCHLCALATRLQTMTWLPSDNFFFFFFWQLNV